jgi:hypothetical protein
MKIASDMFDHYIDKITSTWFGSHDLPADALCEYDALVLEIANDLVLCAPKNLSRCLPA